MKAHKLNIFLTLIVLLICAPIFSQNVGIGQPNPTNTLHVKPITTNTNPIRIEGLLPAGALDNSFLSFDPNTGVMKHLSLTQLIALVGGGSGGGASDNDWVNTNTSLPPTSNSDDIFTQGNVGIGTSSPSQQLHIHTTGTWAGTRVTNASSGPTIGDGVNFGYDDQHGAYAWNREATNFKIATSNLERVVITPIGNVGIAALNPTSTLSVNGTASKTGGGTWNVFSDKNIKQNISPYSNGIDLLSKVNVVSYQYNSHYTELFGENEEVKNKKTFYGVIAQELQKIAPDMVREIEIKEEKILEVDPNKFTYLLINSVKQQQKEIETLKEEIRLLKEFINKNK